MNKTMSVSTEHYISR